VTVTFAPDTGLPSFVTTFTVIVTLPPLLGRDGETEPVARRPPLMPDEVAVPPDPELLPVLTSMTVSPFADDLTASGVAVA